MQPSFEFEPIFPHELRDAWPALSRDERVESFKLVAHATTDDFFLSLSAREQAELVLALAPGARRTWMRLLAPDDAVDVIQAAPHEAREELLAELDEPTRREVQALMAYAEDEAGGLMNPRFVRVRPEMTIDEALSYVRRQTRERAEAVYYAYILDSAQHLNGIISLRQLLQAPSDKRVHEVMRKDVIAVSEDADQEGQSKLFAEHKFMAVPVLDAEGPMKGVVTVDDIVKVVQEEATEDIHKVGGMEALDVPYFDTGFGTMLRKRGGAGVDPASASAPFVATLVDVAGLVIYFTVASLILRGTLL
jgi:magnesium transporter